MQTTLIEDTIKVQPKGLITLPKKMREMLGIKERSLLRIQAQKDKIIIQPTYTSPYPVRTFTDEEINEWLELDEKEGKELRKAGIIK